jgi:hypothetical protein
VRDLVISKDVRVLSDADMVVATVTEQTVEVEETPAVAPVEGEVASGAATQEGTAETESDTSAKK